MATLKDNIVYGGPVLSSITANYKSFGEYSLEKIRSYGDKTILINGTSGVTYSGKILYDEIIKKALSLQELNIKEGDVIGVCSENSVEFMITMFATFCLNATFAPYNVTYTERELQHVINLSKPKVFFASSSTAEKISKLMHKNKFVKHGFIYAEQSPFKNLIPYSKLTNKKSSKFMHKAVDKAENVLLLVCSSGTTGLPKGVQLTQKNILNTVDRQKDLNLTDGLTLLTVLPWFHGFGCLTLILSLVGETLLVFLPRFEEHAFLNAIEKYKVNIAFTVPPLMVFLAKHPMVDKYDLSSMAAFLCGAAPLSEETIKAVKDRIGVQIIRQGYGLSESTLSLLVQSDIYCKPGSVGGLKLGHYAKVIDPETKKILGPNQHGELCFKGDCIMKGYIGDKSATDNIIDKDGWMHTGDIGYYDSDLEFFIVDRLKELIKYKAFQVPPAEIESLLLTNPKIKDAAVVGLPDELSGELPYAFVVKQPNVELTENEVMAYVASRTSSPKRLRGGVAFVNEIPKNPSGKILRRVLRDSLKQNKLKAKL